MKALSINGLEQVSHCRMKQATTIKSANFKEQSTLVSTHAEWPHRRETCGTAGLFCFRQNPREVFCTAQPTHVVTALAVFTDHELCLSIEAGVHPSVRGKPFQCRESVSLGHNVELSVNVEPNRTVKKEQLKYQWHQNNKAIPNANDSKLHIERVQDFHEGIYHCQISEEGMSNDDESVEQSPMLELHMASPGEPSGSWLSARCLLIPGNWLCDIRLARGFQLEGQGSCIQKQAEEWYDPTNIVSILYITRLFIEIVAVHSCRNDTSVGHRGNSVSLPD